MEEMELSERLDAMRCEIPGCGTGLGYPVIEGGVEGGLEGGLEGGVEGGKEGGVDGWVRRCCVHCGGGWWAPPLYDE